MDERDENEAWQEYLRVTAGKPTLDYERIEPWAWGRLQRRLKRLGKKVSKHAA